MWRTVKLGDELSIARGGSPRPIKSFITDEDDGINWIKIGDTTQGGRYIESTKEKIKPSGVSRSRYVKSGDFLLSNSMSFGRPYILKTDGCIHDGWLVLSDYEETFTADYLYYLLSSTLVQNQFEKLARGSTVRNLNTELVSRVVVNVPPLAEQQRTVAKLDAAFAEIDRAIELISQQLEESSVLLKTLLKSMFAATGRTERTFAEVCTLKRGYDLPKKDRNPGEYPLYSANGVTDYIDEYKVRAPTVVTGRSGTIGEVHYSEHNIWALNTALYVKDFKGNLEKYIYYFLKSFDLKKYASGAGVPTLNRNSLSEETVHIDTDVTLQIAVVKKMDGAYSAKEQIDRLLGSKMTALTSLKSAILAQELQPPQSEAA